MMGEISGFGWGMSVFGSVTMLLFWGVVLLGIVAMVKWLALSPGQLSERQSLEILKQRYAHGYINQDEEVTKNHKIEK